MAILSARCKNKFLGIVVLTALIYIPCQVNSQTEIPDEVLDIFDNRCAFVGCHVGTTSPKNLDLSEDFALSSLVNKPSVDAPSYLRVKPLDPVRSYLIIKLKGSAGIVGEKMPKGSGTLSQSEIGTIENWINSLPAELKTEASEREYAEAFPGLSLATLTTTQTLEKGTFSYRIAHRWVGKVGDGFGQFFGLDGGAHMLTQLAFSLSDNLVVDLARSGNNATFEFGAKWRFMREKSDGSVPLSAAVNVGLDWETVKEILDPDNPAQFLKRSNGERFHWFGQIALSKQLSDRISVLLVPGVLLNGNVNSIDEDAIFTVGFAGKFMLVKDFSVFIEGMPILSGDGSAAPVGGARPEGGQSVFNDAFTIGLERKIGGHVFHVYVTNSLGLAAGQYMSGGDLDFMNGDFRLGFNIYRILKLPF